jgi:hypothetical protein
MKQLKEYKHEFSVEEIEELDKECRVLTLNILNEEADKKESADGFNETIKDLNAKRTTAAKKARDGFEVREEMLERVLNEDANEVEYRLPETLKVVLREAMQPKDYQVEANLDDTEEGQEFGSGEATEPDEEVLTPVEELEKTIKETEQRQDENPESNVGEVTGKPIPDKPVPEVKEEPEPETDEKPEDPKESIDSIMADTSLGIVGKDVSPDSIPPPTKTQFKRDLVMGDGSKPEKLKTEDHTVIGSEELPALDRAEEQARAAANLGAHDKEEILV